MTISDEMPASRLTVEVDVVTDEAGGSTAVVLLGGELWVLTYPQLEAALERLLHASITRVVVDLGGLAMCTSHGFDTLDRFHRSMEALGGYVLLTGARGSVARSLAHLQGADATFMPHAR